MLLSALALIKFILVDGHRKQIKHGYIAVIGTLTESV
ncbi:hypothetical protein [Pseudoalteromonas sp. SMS1]